MVKGSSKARPANGSFYLCLLGFLAVQSCMYWIWQHSSFARLICDSHATLVSVVDDLDYLRDLLSSGSSEMIPWSDDNESDDTDEENRLSGNDEEGYTIPHDNSDVFPRAFDPWPEDVPFPCVRNDDKWWVSAVQRSPAQQGLLFVKEMKCGSSTASGVAIRIARNMARRTPNFQGPRKLCKIRFDHYPASRLKYANREKEKSFLWTIIREPNPRAVSQFFHFEVSRKKVEPSDRNFKTFLLNSTYIHNYYLRDLSLRGYKNGDDEVETANLILADYDFIGITERMDESLVVLQMLLHLKTNDVIYLSAKTSGSYDDGGFNGTCTFIVPSFVSPGMEHFLSHEPWSRIIGGDYLLYHAANKSLDLTIDRLGRAEFEKNLERFQKAKAMSALACSQVRYPCGPDGVFQMQHDCLWHDSGCGVECLDSMEEFP